MKVYWWQGGLHLEPENDEERKALQRITQDLKLIDLRTKPMTGKVEYAAHQ